MLKEMTDAEMQCELLLADMDKPHAAILEGYWMGFSACDIAEQVGETPRNVAMIMDTFRELGY